MNVYKEIANLIVNSSYTVVFTGAGMSAESGIPTFRGDNGLWKKYDPMELATYEAFRRDPVKVWEWYKWRMERIINSHPHAGYYIIARWEEKGYVKKVITQNVDGLHIKVGSKNVIELHGNIFRARCISCNFTMELKEPPTDIPPHCPVCGGLLRPDVVWFGEALDSDKLSQAYQAAVNSDVFIVIGTSGVVYPAAELPFIAKQHGAKIIEINIEETPISVYADYTINTKASEALTKIDYYINE